MNQQFESNMSAGTTLKCNCKTENTFASKNATSRCCLKQKLWSMFLNRCHSDVCFIVGREPERQEIYAHKSVLSISSSVFEVMFGERWSATSNFKRIEIPDIEVPVFSSILRFMYTDEILLTVDSVLKIQHAAKKYAILTLENQCADFLKQELEADKVCSLLTQAKVCGETELVESCLKVIDKSAEIAFESDSFTGIDLAALKMILVRDSLTIKEVDLFKAILRWSTAQCMKKDLPVNPGNQKSVLKEALSLVRFPLMTLHEFASSVVPSELLSSKETAAVLLHFADETTNRTSRTRDSLKQPSLVIIPDKLKAKKKMQIFVKSASGKTFTYDVEATDSVTRLKSQIEEKEGVPARLLHLVCGGRFLEDNLCMSDYNIEKESTLHCFCSMAKSANDPKSQEENQLPTKLKV